jgi:hypothetical protein
MQIHDAEIVPEMRSNSHVNFSPFTEKTSSLKEIVFLVSKSNFIFVRIETFIIVEAAVLHHFHSRFSCCEEENQKRKDKNKSQKGASVLTRLWGKSKTEMRN